jgi:hypothetical protein
MNFFEFAENLKNYPTIKFIDELLLSIEKNNLVADLQRSQWDEGLDSEGNILGRYSLMTQIITDGRKKAGDPFDIDDTGETRKNLELFSKQESQTLLFHFDSHSQALPNLLQRVGPRLFGLQEKNLDKFTAITQDNAIDLLNTNLKLK